MPATSDSTTAGAGTTESNGLDRQLSRENQIGDPANLGFPGAGMQCWLKDVALVAAEVEDNPNVTLPDVRKEARAARGGHRVSSGA